jgi:hypothetical protein
VLVNINIKSSQVIHQVHLQLFIFLTKVKYSLPTVHDRGRGYSNSFETSAEGYTLPTRFNTSAGRNPRIVIHKVCGVQINKQILSLVYSSIGSFPRARDTDISVPASLVLPAPGCRMDGNFPLGSETTHAWTTSIKDDTRPPILE